MQKNRIPIELEITDKYKYDYCIVGSGIAGLILSNELIASKKSICLIEEGYIGKTNDTPLNSVINKGIDHKGIFEGRFVAFGGSSTAWGGQLLPFQNNDFKKRNYLNHEGWPIKNKDLLPYLSKAEKLLGVNQLPYNKSLLKYFRNIKNLPEINGINIRFSKWIPISKRNLANTLGKKVLKSNIDFYQGSKVSKLKLKRKKNEVDGVEVINLKKERIFIRAETIIIASGTIESCRILLNSPDLEKNINFDPNKNLGKFFHDHLSIISGTLKDKSRKTFLQNFAPFYKNSTRHSPKFEASPEWQRKNLSLNIMAHFIYESKQNSFINKLRKVISYYQKRNHMKINIFSLLPSFKDIKNILNLITKFIFFKRKWAPIDSKINIVIDSEQLPNKESKLTKSKEVDEFGLSKIDLNWNWGAKEFETFKIFKKHLKENLEEKIGEIEWDSKTDNFDFYKKLVKDPYHMMGGTIMSNNPKHGIVDENLKVHNIKNLYIASCSNFPSGGSSNPTLTLILLTLRLSDFLKNKNLCMTK